MVKEKETSRWWWFESHQNSSNHSPWLHSTLSELDAKTTKMLKLIEGDADSFAQRAEMYYKKRPELISMVEDFYRAHRALAERYDQLKSENGARNLTAPAFSFPATKSHQETLESICDNQSEMNSATEEYAESEVDDPEHENRGIISPCKWSEEAKDDEKMCEEEVSSLSKTHEDEMVNLRQEIEKLRRESEAQKKELIQKDEEKREVIRQLSLAMEIFKDENSRLRKRFAEESPKNWTLFEFKQLEWFFGNLFQIRCNSKKNI